MADEEKVVETAAPSNGSAEDTEKGKSLAWLSYLGILWLVPMLANKENAFCKFHVKQGIILTVFGFAVGVVGAIPFIGWFIIWPVGCLFALVMAIIGIIQSVSGKYWKMPLLGGLAQSWFKF
ncbi:hypothetical protein FJY69_09425 [candidate division WOR-3 bacterium]|nr:hypothetical protein [candidate division WOR-3 bacterium]